MFVGDAEGDADEKVSWYDEDEDIPRWTTLGTYNSLGCPQKKIDAPTFCLMEGVWTYA